MPPPIVGGQLVALNGLLQADGLFVLSAQSCGETQSYPDH